MTFDKEHAVERIAASPLVRQAAQSALDLTQLWPLSSPEQIENDAKYAENLQVRLSRTVARVLTGNDITIADAEFVYEGAESIPGRDQSSVDALIAANNAIDMLSAYSQESASSEIIVQAAQELDAQWSAETQQAIVKRINEAQAYAKNNMQESIAWKFAVVIVLFAQIVRECQNQEEADLGNDMPHPGGFPEERAHILEKHALVGLLFANEFAEVLGVPRIYLSAAQYHGVITATATMNGDSDIADAAEVLAQAVSPIAGAEWKAHRADVLFNRAEAKQQAKEEEKRKNKEALASKFAHVQDDPNKKEVEL